MYRDFYTSRANEIIKMATHQNLGNLIQSCHRHLNHFEAIKDQISDNEEAMKYSIEKQLPLLEWEIIERGFETD